MGTGPGARLRQLIRRSVTAGLAVAVLASCGSESGSSTSSEAPEAPTTIAAPVSTLPRRLTVLALGDSFTSGEGVSAEERWPDQLAQRLGERGVDVTVDYVAGTGWNSTRIWRELSRADAAGRYDLVTVQAGVNDQFLRFGLENYRQGLERLLGTAIEFAGGEPGRVLALSIADWTVTPRGAELAREDTSAQIAAHCELLRAEAESRSIVFADVTALSRESATDPTLVAADGLHFSGALYSRWVDEVILPLVEAIVVR